jgi:diguanylate cyclase (GGDEF)-like protein
LVTEDLEPRARGLVLSLGAVAAAAFLLALALARGLSFSSSFAVLAGLAMAFEGLSAALPRYGHGAMGFVVCFASLARPAALYPGGQLPGRAGILAEALALAFLSVGLRALLFDRHRPWSRAADAAVGVLRVLLVGLVYLLTLAAFGQGSLVASAWTVLALALAGAAHWGVDRVLSAAAVGALEGEEAREGWLEIYSRYGLLTGLGQVVGGYLLVAAAGAFQAAATPLPASLLLGGLVALVPALLVRGLLRYGTEAAARLEEEKKRRSQAESELEEEMARRREREVSLSRDLQKKKEDLQMLHEMDRDLGASQGLDEALEIVLSLVGRMRIPHQSCVIFLREGDNLVPRRYVTPYKDLLEISSLLALREGLVQKVLETRKPQLASETLPEESRIFKGEGSSLAVPLSVARDVFGVIYVGARAAGVLNQDHLETLATLATHAAPAIKLAMHVDHKARALEEEQGLRTAVEARNRQLAGLQNMIAQMGNTLQLEEIAGAVVEGVAEMLPEAQSVALLLTAPGEEELRPLAVRSPYETYMMNLVLRRDEGLLGKAIEERKAVVVYDTHHNSVPNLLENERSAIVAPMIKEGELLGCIYSGAAQENAFTEEQRGLIETVSYQAALAIKNARLYKEKEAQALTDGLTGLYTHRYFQQRLDEEVNGHIARKRPLSLVMVDTDHFKTFNDTLGHPEGDKLLKEIAALLKDNVRASDLVCRYGGDEFALILRDCSPDRAEEIAHRIREAFQIRFATRAVRVTASIGLACLPTHALTKKQLAKAADDALYESKRGGRNRVTVAPVYDPGSPAGQPV